jgi:EmrB/QacA subfamily drug resistance transporter
VTDANRRWWTLGALSFSLFMIMLDNTVVNVALPSIQRELGVGDIADLEWVVNAYALSFAVLMLTGGKLADFFGRRRVFLAGLALFTATSLGCALAASLGTLVGWRAAQGLGAALMLPATLAIITHTFPLRERGTAIGIWAGVSALALAIGPLVGGAITEHISWSWVFYINVPVGVLGLVAGLALVPESRDTSRLQRLDLPGLLVSAAALFALTFALSQANDRGWGSPLIVGLLVAFVVGTALFVVAERRGDAPMLDLQLFRDGTFAGATLCAMLVTLAMFGVFFFMTLYVQRILGYSPVEAGAVFLPMTVLIIVVAPIAGRVSDRIGSRWLMAGGMLLTGVCLLLFSRLGQRSGFVDLLPGLLLGGIGMASVMTPMSAAAMRSAPVDKSGVAAGVLNTARQVGGALGIALMGAIMTSRIASAEAAGATMPAAFVDGFQVALLVGAAITFTGALVAALMVRQHPRLEPRRELAEASA